MVPLNVPNVDTDQIIPKQFLKRVERTGFGQFLFFDWRFTADGKPNPEFVTNDEKYSGSKILLARENFGCGSSREHAPWALLDYGFQVIVAPSYADIFYNNCFQNGILPITLDNSTISELFTLAESGSEFVIDLENQSVTDTSGGKTFAFEIDANRKNTLIKGLDDISWTLQFSDKIAEYESNTPIF